MRLRNLKPAVAASIALIPALMILPVTSQAHQAARPATHATHAAARSAVQSIPGRELALRQAMRRLWEDHVTWTRLVIVSTVANLPDLDATTQRLLQNQTDIGNAIKPYYGEAAGNALTALLRTHIVGAADILAAAKADDAARLDAAKKSWYANADEIATFLSHANPKNWPQAEMQSMMHRHLDLTLAEAVAQLQGKYADSVTAYDQVHDEILQMADMLSGGLVRQFRGKLQAGS